MSWTKAKWTKGKRTIEGIWYWDYSVQRFFIHIYLASPNSITGRTREEMMISGESPEWHGWKLVKV